MTHPYAIDSRLEPLDSCAFRNPGRSAGIITDPATTIVTLSGRAYAAHSVSSTQAAEQFLQLHPDWSVLHVQANGIVVLAHADKAGWPEP